MAMTRSSWSRRILFHPLSFTEGRATIRCKAALALTNSSAVPVMMFLTDFSATMIGGDGNDHVVGGPDADTFVWNPGDDNDTLEGRDGEDTLLFNGSGATE